MSLVEAFFVVLLAVALLFVAVWSGVAIRHLLTLTAEPGDD